MNSLTHRFSANYIYTNTGEPIRNGVVGLDDGGVVVEIIDHKEEVKEYSRTIFRSGVIIPGFVSSPILSELSNLIDMLPQGNEIEGFLSSIKSYSRDRERNTYWQSLSTFNQIQIILNHFPLLSFDEVLKWATLLGAMELGIDDERGSIELGKKPGLNLISPFNFKASRLKETSRVMTLI
jgi:cytosine/adenosine deaminase-related metal-dependent hydrolase